MKPGITISRALTAEYPVILNRLPPQFFGTSPHLVHLQVAEMVSSNHFLIAHTEDELVGAIGWQENVAFGAMYAKFLFVKQEFAKSAVAARLGRELVSIASETGQRAIFADIPEKSTMADLLRKTPGCREVGSVEGFQEEGVRSLIFRFDVSQSKAFITHADSEIGRSS